MPGAAIVLCGVEPTSPRILLNSSAKIAIAQIIAKMQQVKRKTLPRLAVTDEGRLIQIKFLQRYDNSN